MNKITIALLSFFIGMLCMGLFAVKVATSYYQVGTLESAHNAATYLNIFKNAPQELERLLTYEAACSLSRSLELKDTILWHEDVATQEMTKFIEEQGISQQDGCDTTLLHASIK